MAADSFRSQLSSMGWSRREPEPVNTAPPSGLLGSLSRLNPFAPSDGYVRLPTSNDPPTQLPARTRQEEEAGWFALSYYDRLLAFTACNLGAAVCFVTCFFLFPVLSLRPRKFAILWTVGSILFLASWAVLQGPVNYGKHLLGAQRLPFTCAYLGSIVITLWAAIGIKSTILTFLAAIAQLVALVWYLVSYFPMGSQGLRFASNLGASSVAGWMRG